MQGKTEAWAEEQLVAVTLERDQLAAENKSLHIKLALLTNERHASSKAEVRPCDLLAGLRI